MIPAGLPGVAEINGTCYRLELNAELPEVGEPVVHGYRLTNLESGQPYDVDVSSPAITCDCPDSTFRRGTAEHKHCKHCLGVIRLFPENVPA